jgi:hypothetical protein
MMPVSKIDRPPYAHNWVRYNFPDFLKTVEALVRFIVSFPQITYAAGMPIIRDRIALGLDRETALKAATNKGHRKSRPYVCEFVEAFYDYDLVRNYSGLPSYDQYVAPFMINREIVIPVKPLIVISEEGVLKPIFVVGWATMPLTNFQRRLLATLLEDAVFSLTDFQKSPGEFVSFPRTEGTNSGKRSPLVWGRGDYDLLSPVEMKAQTELYLQALAQAKSIVAERKGNTAQTTPTAQQPSTQKEMDLSLDEGEELETP